MDVLKDIMPELKCSCIEFARLHIEMERVLQKMCFLYTQIIDVVGENYTHARIDIKDDTFGNV